MEVTTNIELFKNYHSILITYLLKEKMKPQNAPLFCTRILKLLKMGGYASIVLLFNPINVFPGVDNRIFSIAKMVTFRDTDNGYMYTVALYYYKRSVGMVARVCSSYTDIDQKWGCLRLNKNTNMGYKFLEKSQLLEFILYKLPPPTKRASVCIFI